MTKGCTVLLPLVLQDCSPFLLCFGLVKKTRLYVAMVIVVVVVVVLVVKGHVPQRTVLASKQLYCASQASNT